MIRVPDGSLRILVQGISRIRLLDRLQDEPYLVGRFVDVHDVYEESPEAQALTQNVQTLFVRLSGSSRTCRRSSPSPQPMSTTRARSAIS